MKGKINSYDIRAYLVSHIREFYKGFDDRHDERHFDEVYRFMEIMCKSLNFDQRTTDMMLTAAAFHDVGRLIDSVNHEVYSAKALHRDKFIKKYFDKNEINDIESIIEAHRSSAVAYNIYQKLLKDADKACRLDSDRQIYRLIAYNCMNSDLSTYDIYEKMKRTIETSGKFLTGWFCEETGKVFGECPDFYLPEFEVVSKRIEDYRNGII